MEFDENKHGYILRAIIKCTVTLAFLFINQIHKQLCFEKCHSIPIFRFLYIIEIIVLMMAALLFDE